MASAYSMDLEKIKELVPAEDIKLDLAVNKAIDLIKSSAEVSESAPEKKKAPAKKKAAAKEEKNFYLYHMYQGAVNANEKLKNLID